MALTVAVLDPPVFPEFTGQKGFKRATITFDSSYLTGGEVLSASSLGLSTIDTLQITPRNFSATESMQPVWDKTDGTVMLSWTGGAISSHFDEITSATDVAAVTCEVLAYGKLA